MAKPVNFKKGAGIIVDPSRIGTLDQFVAKERPAATGKRRIVTTWECLNCGNSLASTRGVSRCPHCGSLEVTRVDALTPQYQATPKMFPAEAYRFNIMEDGDNLDDLTPDPDTLE